MRNYIGKVREQYKKFTGKETPYKFTDVTLQKFVSWHSQARGQEINWRKLEQQFLKENTPLIGEVSKRLNSEFKMGQSY